MSQDPLVGHDDLIFGGSPKVDEKLFPDAIQKSDTITTNYPAKRLAPAVCKHV